MSTLDTNKRRELMARFKSKNTKPELLVRRALHAAGRRFRLHVKDLPGCPDIVLPRDRTVVMVHGCFWHAHEGCATARVPSTRQEFWVAKFAANKTRDAKNQTALGDKGWRVVTIWECEARSAGLQAILEHYGLIASFDRKVNAESSAMTIVDNG